MRHAKTVSLLVGCILVAGSIAAGTGVFLDDGPGPSEHVSVRGETVTLHGRGPYRQMSADVAVQGIAQDYVTLFLGVPALAVALMIARKGSLRGRLFLAGVLGYFLVTYLFYLMMGTYNRLFLLYAFLLGTSFFAFALTMLDFDLEALPDRFAEGAPTRFAGGFLVVNAGAVALLWLGVVLPPLADGTLYPPGLQHYTTLVVQGLDLGLLLPLSVVSGVLLYRRRPIGYLMGTVYLVFLSFLMIALVAKIVAMGLVGEEIIPVVFIMPTLAVVAAGSAGAMLRSV